MGDAGNNMSGTCGAWEPVYRTSEDEDWKRIPLRGLNWLESIKGVPHPLKDGGVLYQIGYYGYAQSMALAWAFKAMWDADRETIGKRIYVGIRELSMTYSIETEIVHEWDLREEDRSTE